MTLIQSIAIVNTILLIWFKTNAFVEYSKLLGIKFKDFEQKKLDIPNLLYSTYVSELGWFGRLLSCPFCLSFWLCLIINISSLNLFFISYILTLTIYQKVFK